MNVFPYLFSKSIISQMHVFHGKVMRVRLTTLRHAIDLLIYPSVALGVLLLLQIYVLVPTWLFYSVLVGWFAYLIIAVAAATGREIAYPLAFVLSVLTLVVSLPQPEHYSFASEGMWTATLTFATGSVLQIALLILIPIYLIKKRRATS
jgi:hypothetical protein